MSVVVGNYLNHLSTRVRPGKKQAPILIILILAGFLYLTGGLNTSLVLAQADVASATLKGLITDQAGAGIGQATITVTSVDRGTVRSAKTDDEGIYRLSLLQPGSYELRVDANGFQSQVLQRIVVTVGQIDVHDFKFEVGRVNETVRITAAPAAVETERTQQSATIQRRQIATLPNLSRNFTSYIFIRPGITICGTTAQPGFINGCDPKFLYGPFDFKGVRRLPPTAPLGFRERGTGPSIPVWAAV
jgi:hypothetical protein